MHYCILLHIFGCRYCKEVFILEFSYRYHFLQFLQEINVALTNQCEKSPRLVSFWDDLLLV